MADQIPQTASASALAPHTPDLSNGKTLFAIGGCASCHAGRCIFPTRTQELRYLLRIGAFGGDDEKAVRCFVDGSPDTFLGFDDEGPATERWRLVREALEQDPDARLPARRWSKTPTRACPRSGSPI